MKHRNDEIIPYVIIILTILGTVIRVFNINFQSLWLDELYTIEFSKKENSIVQIYGYLRNDGAHPSLYYLIVHFIFIIFGNSEFVLRIISCLIGVIMIPCGYNLGKNLMNKKFGLILSSIITFSPYLIKYSQEGRMYIFFALLSLLITNRFISLQKHFNRNDLYFYLFYSILIVNIHFYGYFLVLCFSILILIKYYRSIKYKDYFVISSLFFIANLSNIYILLKSAKKESFWITKPTSNFILQFFSDFYFGNGILLLLSILLIFYGVTKSKNITLNDNIFSIFIPMAGTIILSLIISYLKLPMIVERHYIGFYTLFLIILSFGFYNINSKYSLFCISVYIFYSYFSFFYLYQYYGKQYKDDFREASNYIKNNNNVKFVSKIDSFFNFYTEKNPIINDSINGKKAENLENFYYIERIGGPYSVTKEQLKSVENKIEVLDTIKFKNINFIHVKKITY